MPKSLYMICPSDFLEPVIDKAFEGGKFFYTSLGNTIPLDQDVLEQLAAIIGKHGIEEITFILSDDNNFVRDALNDQHFVETRGLNLAYRQLVVCKKQAQGTWQMYNHDTLILSYHLNKKISELKSGLQDHFPLLPQINGKVFSRFYNSFRQIYPDLVCIEPDVLN